MKNSEIIEKVTQKIIERMESGKLNWNKPWNGGMLPQNYISKNPYRGWNLFITLFSEFSSPYYLTFKQVTQLKGKIKTGSKGLPITFWGKYEKPTGEKDEKGEVITKKFLILKDWTVFNAEQVEGIEFKKFELKNYGTCEDLEQAINSMKIPVKIKHSVVSRGAYYTPALDEISMPEKGQFSSLGEYYATLVHEVIHSTGHSNRTNRFKKNGEEFEGKGSYSYEELVAELGSAYMCAMFGISTENTEKNNAAYLQGWLKRFKNDTQMLYKATSDAQKAVDYILGIEYNADAKKEVE